MNSGDDSVAGELTMGPIRHADGSTPYRDDPGLPFSEPLATSVARLGARVQPGIPLLLRLLVGRSTVAVTLGRRVWFAERLMERPAALERIVNHELEHVRQMQQVGIVWFLYEYLREYLIHRANGLEPADAYRSIGFEEQARAAEMPTAKPSA